MWSQQTIAYRSIATIHSVRDKYNYVCSYILWDMHMLSLWLVHTLDVGKSLAGKFYVLVLKLQNLQWKSCPSKLTPYIIMIASCVFRVLNCIHGHRSRVHNACYQYSMIFMGERFLLAPDTINTHNYT